MLRNKLLEKLSNNSDVLIINHSRCLRMRFDDNENKCSRCAEACSAGVIDIEGLEINRKACTECMLCASECPSGGIEISGVNFYSIILKLRKVPGPVLGCSIKESLKAHVNTFCMGLLSEERLLALMVFLNAPLQINLTECSACKNSFIVDVLKKRLESINSKFIPKESGQNSNTAPYPLSNITLIEDKSLLQFEDVPCDRRAFFGMLKKLTMEGAANVISDTAEVKDKPIFSEQLLPFRRKLLNKTLSTLMELEKEGHVEKGRVVKMALQSYFYNIQIDENCDLCSSCVGMCPTGALEESYGDADDSPKELLFNHSLCIGCGLCAEFCLQKSIVIEKGFAGEDPFGKMSVKKETFEDSV